MLFLDKIFFVLEEDCFLDDNKFKDDFDDSSTSSLRVLWLDAAGLLVGALFGDHIKNIHAVDKSRIRF